MKNVRLVTLILLIGALALSACQQPAATTPPPAANDNTSNENGAVSPPTTANDNGAAPSADAPNLELTDVTAGLSALDSYQLTFSMTFEGTNAEGQPESSAFGSIEEFSKSPLAKRTTVTGMGAAGLGSAEDGGIQIIEVDGKTYSIFGDTCAVADADSAPEASAMFNPSDIIGDISSSQFVGVENVNGVQARHYLVDVSSLQTLGAYTQAKAEAWVVGEPAQFVVKYTFEATGTDTFFGTGTGAEGTLRWDYEVDKVNQPLDITAPENCGGAPDDIPIMADAVDTTSFSGITSYGSPTAFADVVAFYKTQMPANGWTEDASSGTFATDDFTTLSFTKEGRTASITITADSSSGETTVLIQVSE